MNTRRGCHPGPLPVFVPAAVLVLLSCRGDVPRVERPETLRHWKYISGGWDVERPAVMLRGKVQDGTRRLFAAWQMAPKMLVPVVGYRCFAEMQLRILGINRACWTFERRGWG